MKHITGTVLGLAAILLGLSLASAAPAQPIPSDLVLIATNQIPRSGVLYSIANLPWYAPYPPCCWTFYAAQGVQFYYSPSLGANTVFMDDRELVAMQAALRLAARAANGEFSPDDNSGTGGPVGFNYSANDFWLEPVSVASNLFNVILHGTTNGSTYLITSTETLDPQTSSTWLIEGTVQGGTNDATPFALGIATRTNNLFIRAQACDECAATALPLWWQLDYFGVTGVDPSSDLDNDGVNNLQEYFWGRDPNKIAFRASFPNDQVSADSVIGTVVVQRGIPSQMAVLIDSTNFTTTTNWTAYSSSVPVPLGSTDGPHDVWIGLKGLAQDSVQTWEGFRLARDTAAPAIHITSPPPGTVCRPVLQLQGYSLEPLASVRYDVANAAGTLTGLEGYATRQWFDTNLLAFTTNWFECQDIQLTDGVNTITLYATDLAGNVSTNAYNYTLDYSDVTNLPALTLYWPQDGAQVSGTSFNLRGLLDDPTATVTAQITDGSGVTNQVEGLIERNGLLWVENLPLGPGANTLTLMMTNAAGLWSSTSLTVTQSDVVLIINDLSATDLNQPAIFVSGTISADGYTVWVNGMAVTNVWANGDGTWSWQVDGVPVNDGGTAVIQARAIPNTDLGGNGTGGSGGTISTMENPGNPFSPEARDAEADEDKQSEVVKVHYDIELNDVVVWPGPMGGSILANTQTIQYDRGFAGKASATNCRGPLYDEYWTWSDSPWGPNETGTAWSGGGRGSNICGIKDTGWFGPCQAQLGGREFCQVSPTRTEYETQPPNGFQTRTRTARTRYELHTRGKALSQRKNLFVLSARAYGVGDFFWPEMDLVDIYGFGIDPANTILGDFGPEGYDGRIYKVLPDNSTNNITPRVPGNPYYTFDEPVASKHHLRILANGCNCEAEHPPQTPEFIVGQIVTFTGDWEQSQFSSGTPPDIAVPTNQWTFSGHYLNDPSQPCPECSVNYTANPTFLTNDSPWAWWVSGKFSPAASYPVELVKGLTFANGQHVILEAYGGIQMYRPEGKISPSTSSVGVYGSLLIFGDPNLTNTGITFLNTIAIPSGFSGSREWAQVVLSTSTTRKTPDSTTYELTQNGLGPPYGDTPIPYGEFDSTHTNPVDSPFVELGSQFAWYATSDFYEMWMMFRPNGGQWVPLRAVVWYWSGSATNGPGGWGLKSDPGDHSVNPSDFDTEDYPSWYSNANDQQWKLMSP